MTIDQPNRQLLLGILALQMDFISREELIAATSVWLQDKSRPIEEILTELNALSTADRQLLLPLVDRHIKNHEDDADKSLAALSSIGSLADDLRTLGDQQVDATLSVVASEGLDSSTSSVPPRSAAADSTAPRYRTLRPHAKGGLGEVSVAEDTELNREVALKVIQPQYAHDEGSRTRFVLEAEVTGGLEHPGIVPVYGLGHYEDGRPFYAMRFIRGDSLKEAADQFHHQTKREDDGGRREEEVTTVHVSPSYDSVAFRRLLGRFVDVCNAVAYAHSRGVLHRDLKPGNIMLGKYGETLVVDWGLAKVKGRDDATMVDGETTLNPRSGSGSARTQMGRAMGTPSYMPPEQAAGNLDQIGPASDVYSLGATLYYLLAGQPPISSSNLEDVLTKVRAGDFQPPRRLRHSIPRPLESICMKAMATSPADRYESPQSLADDVERFLADEPVEAHAERLVSRLRRWMRKHPTSVAALVMLALGLSGIALVQFRANRVLSGKNNQLQVAQQQTATARDRAQRRGDLAVEAIDRFRTAVEDNVDVKNRPELKSLRSTLLQAPKDFYQSLTAELAQSDEADRDTLERLAKAEYQLASLTRIIDSRDRAVLAYQAAQDKYETLLSMSPNDVEARQQLAEIHNSLGGIYLEQKTLDQAEEEYRTSLAMRRDLLQRSPQDIKDHVSAARVLVNLSMVEGARGRVDEALDNLTEATGLLEEAFLQESQDTDARYALSRALQRRGAVLSTHRQRHDEALKCLERSMELAEGLVEENPDNDQHHAVQIYALEQLSYIYERMGNDAQAWSFAEQAQTLLEELVKKNPTNTHFQFNLTGTLARIADLQFARDEVAASLASMENVLELRSKLCDAHPGNVMYRESLSNTVLGIGSRLYSLGRVEDALQKFRDLIPIQEELVELQPDDIAPGAL